MQSFNKMVKDKRAKILILVILLFALNSVYRTHGLKVPDLIHLIKNDTSGKEGLCIAFGEDAYSAIEWSFPIPEDENSLPETVSSYHPNDLSPTYDCSFEDNLCKNLWVMDNWTIPTYSPLNYIPILDSRWEDFRTYISDTNITRMSENRFAIHNNASIGISIRSDSTVNILLCEGFNPASYPCYTITLGGNTTKEVYIRKYGSTKKIWEYKSHFPVLYYEEWRNFNLLLSATGRIQLTEMNKNSSYADIIDPTPLNIRYLFVNSTLPSMWKIHENNFLFTQASQSVPFGPPLNTTSSTVCLSMYLMMCNNCSIYFYTIKNISKEIVSKIVPGDDSSISNQWEHVKFIIENIADDSVQLFVKTNSDDVDRFWAIDDVRTCVADEFKIRKLSKGNFNQELQFNDLTFSCHFVKSPEWRPKKQFAIAAIPMVSNAVNYTSIDLSWEIAYPQPYLIKYKASDICNRDTITQIKSRHRLKSNGWIVVKPKQTRVIIENLVPYAYYDLSIIDPVYGQTRNLSMSTYATQKPTKDELRTVIIKPETHEAKILLLPIKCNVSYGPLVYEVDVIQQSKPSLWVFESGNVHTWKDLEPYQNYTLSLKTARKIENLKNATLYFVNYYNFTTKPDVASVIQPEIYESSETSMSFRYELPKKPNGSPTLLQIAVCNSLLRENCNYSTTNITHCSLWPNLYCITINNLMKKTSYTFKLSIKNNNTNAFGNETIIAKSTMEEVPGAPANISYKVINCSELNEHCNLNVSWSHPYNQTGQISSFQIFLQDKAEVIMENIPIEDKKYLPQYWYLIKYLPYAKTYNMSIRASNNVYKSLNASIIVKIDHIAKYIEIPTLIESNVDHITFQIPKLDYRLNSSTVTIIVQTNDSTYANIPQELISIAENDLCLHNRTSWIAGIWETSHDRPINVTIGNGSSPTLSKVHNYTITNNRLLPKTEYCINFVTKSVYGNTTYVHVDHEEHIFLQEYENSVPEKSSSILSIGSVIVIIMMLLLVTTVIAFIIYHTRKQRHRNTSAYGEHIYEAMPTDDYNDSCNVVYNAVYDKLNHD